ncbi:MAG: NCS2 family permease [Pseudomonadota bacterium]
MTLIERLFGVAKAGSTVRTEMVAGATTFLSMAYITAVNPGILSETGMDFAAVFVATCLAAAVGSIAMGLLANYPVALAPGMGQNAFFTYAVVLGGGHSWQTALGAVFISGVLFVALSVLPFREWLINAIPRNLKQGIAGGIGLFLGFIALQNAGLVGDNPATLVQIADITAFPAVACLLGFVLIVALTALRVPGAVIIGILSVAALGWFTGQVSFQGVFSAPPSPAPVLFQLDIAGAFQLSMVTVILSFLIVDVFDTAGTLVGVAMRANLLDANHKLPRLRRALLADSGATVAGAVFGTSSTTSFIESGAGVEAGGRTGLTAVVCGVLFITCLFLAPLAQSIPAYATASALLFVACLMAQSLATLDWADGTESAPAIVAAIAMPLTFSIADGIGLGFITYAAVKIFTGKFFRCSPVVYVIALIFVLKYTVIV